MEEIEARRRLINCDETPELSDADEVATSQRRTAELAGRGNQVEVDAMPGKTEPTVIEVSSATTTSTSWVQYVVGSFLCGETPATAMAEPYYKRFERKSHVGNLSGKSKWHHGEGR